MINTKVDITLNIDNNTIEEIKKLRTYITSLEDSIRAICITSSVANEGKSFISFWIANTLANSDKKILLIDADLRKSEKSNIFTISHNEKSKDYNKTLCNYLNGSINKEDIILQTNIDNMFYIQSGEVPNNPSELLSQPLFKDLINNLKSDYDYIIIDTPPIDSVTDPIIISSVCDGCILVVETGIISSKQAQYSVAQISKNNANLLGVVLNKSCKEVL